MKNNNYKIFFVAKVIFLTGLLMFSYAIVLPAQDDTEEAGQKEKARMGLAYTNINNDGPRLTATIKTKVDGIYENIQGVKVNFYLTEVGEDGLLGNAISGKKGEAVLILPESLKKIIPKHNSLLYLATIENDDRFKDNETEIEIRRSYTELTLEIEDSIKQVRFFVGAPDSTGTIVPMEEVEARIYVKRLFGLLPLTEGFETTNEEGILSLEFPDDIPGDENGNLAIVAQVEDHDEFGSLRSTKQIDWGVPLKEDEHELDRELWSARSNAPILLILISNILIIGIWGIIGYIVFLLIKINKIGKNTEGTA
ncbi:MAG: hypothetical protein ACI8VT_003129 [Saprospiraceae bacterium]|jgi:hypothetical protein